MVLNQIKPGWLTGRYREQAHSYNWMVLNQTEHGWLAGRLREQARSYNWMVLNQNRAWLAGRASSRAGSLLQLDRVHPGRNRSAVRPPSRAGSLPQLDGVESDRAWLAGRPLSRASSAPTKAGSKDRSLRQLLHEIKPAPPLGRVSARLLLILMLILEPVGRLSGGIHTGKASRGGAAKQTVGDAPG